VTWPNRYNSKLADHLRTNVIVAASANLADACGSLLRDADHGFAAAYETGDSEALAYLIRPDGYVGFRTSKPIADEILAQQRRVLRW
jgi:hypothetical protein